MMKCSVYLCVLFVGVCLAEIPAVPDLDDIEELKERCNNKGGPGTFDKVKVAKKETQECLEALVNIETLKNEVEEAKKTGSMDEVFGRYCNKRPQMAECIKKTHDAIAPCLEENEKNAINFTANIMKQLGDFACVKDGDRIALFVAEGGVECITSRTEGIKKCFNDTIKFNPASFTSNSLPNLTIEKKHCSDMKTIQNCVVKDMEDHCDDKTPANLVDALFRFIINAACKDVKQKRSISMLKYLI